MNTNVKVIWMVLKMSQLIHYYTDYTFKRADILFDECVSRRQISIFQSNIDFGYRYILHTTPSFDLKLSFEFQNFFYAVY